VKARVEAFANHPDIFPAIASKGRGPFDLSDVWDQCLALTYERGAVVFHLTDPVEVHVLFHRDARTVACVRDALKQLGPRDVLARIPEDLPHCRHLAVALGFKRTGKTEFIERDHGPVRVIHYLRSSTDA
jgi:hypothetical protein